MYLYQSVFNNLRIFTFASYDISYLCKYQNYCEKLKKNSKRIPTIYCTGSEVFQSAISYIVELMPYSKRKKNKLHKNKI